MLRTRSGDAISITAERATYAPATSLCRRVPSFATVDEYPIRSPLAVADFLAPLVAGRSFVEIGTRNGDIMGCLAHFARRVTAIELDVTYCKKLRARGFDVICRPVETVKANEFEATEGDVYFWWPMWAPQQNEAWLRQLITVHQKTGRRAAAYIAHDTHWQPDMQTLRRLRSHYRATNVTRLFFDEGEGAGFGRPGRWGVFHLMRVDLGPDVPLPPWQGEGQLPPRYREGKPADSPWVDGFCAVTDGSSYGDDSCQRESMGSLALGAKFGIRTRQQCVDFCFTRCKNCRYVSFSKELGDCSWYTRCDLSGLQRNINGGEFLPVTTRKVEAAADPALPAPAA